MLNRSQRKQTISKAAERCIAPHHLRPGLWRPTSPTLAALLRRVLGQPSHITLRQHKKMYVARTSTCPISNGDECSYPDSFHPYNVRDTYSIPFTPLSLKTKSSEICLSHHPQTLDATTFEPHERQCVASARRPSCSEPHQECIR